MTYEVAIMLSEPSSSVSAWQVWGTSIIAAAAALSGVAITQRSTRRHEIGMRLWEKRCDAYVSVMHWSDSVYHSLIYARGIHVDFLELDPEDVIELWPSKDVEIPFFAFASREARPHFVACQNLLILLSEASTQPGPNGEASEYGLRVADLQIHLPILDSALQNELAVGGMRRLRWRPRIDADQTP